MDMRQRKKQAFDEIYDRFLELMDSGDHVQFGNDVEAIIEEVVGLPNECPLCYRFAPHGHYID